jgi:hypothetical protein
MCQKGALPCRKSDEQKPSGVVFMKTKIIPMSLIGILLSAFLLPSSTPAAVTLTVANGVANPPPALNSTALTPQQTAIADTVSVMPLANYGAVLSAVLTQQGFSAANNWAYVNNAVTLNPNATFNLTQYSLFLNPGGNGQPGLPNGTAAGSAFGENVNFTLNPNLGAPANLPAGSTATLHWLNLEQASFQVNGFGFNNIPGQQGWWKLDNGNVQGGAAAGAGTGPYYDSNAAPGFSTPPSFFDGPQFYSGIGTYLHFDTIPTWDVFTPAAGGNPATENIDVGNYAVTWGFTIVPEPSLTILAGAGLLVSLMVRKFRRTAAI